MNPVPARIAHVAVNADVSPDRLGGLTWTRRTGGALTARERRRLLGEIVRGQAAYLAGRVRLATGRLPPGAHALAFADLRPPDSAFARAAEEACREQSAAVAGHSHRAWAYGSALAALDGAGADAELLYVACLVHDHGIERAVPGEDFTLRSAARAEACAQQAGAGPEAAAAVADAITVHTTPGIDVATDGALGVYVQAGAMLDLAGLRAGDVPAAYRADVAAAHPRAGITRAIVPLIAAEARANPAGRFGLLHRCGLTVLIRASPMRPR